MKKTLKKIGCTLLAVCSMAIGAVGFTSCTTDRPEVEMQIEFNDETYTLYYTLYRKYAPNTVNHFLALAENGYYNGLCVHNYVSGSKMYTGAYSYDPEGEKDGGLVYKNYYDTVKTYGSFPVSVWRDSNKSAPTYTLYGEFKNNDFKVKNGDFLTQSFGALTMYYTKKPVDIANVWVNRVDSDRLSEKDYKNNSATSRFMISLTTTKDDNYCTFATLNNADALKALQTAIDEFSKDYEDSGSFTKQKMVEVDGDDYYIGKDAQRHQIVTESYAIPVEPIVIKNVKVNKY